MTETAPVNQDNSDTWKTVINTIHRHAPRPISDVEAATAARNLRAFCQTALAIKRRQMHDQKSHVTDSPIS